MSETRGWHRVTEADQTFDEIREAVRAAIATKLGVGGGTGTDVWIRDLNATRAWYEVWSEGAESKIYRIDYSIDDKGTVTLAGEPAEVEVTYADVVESEDRVHGRILEARGSDDLGGRVYEVQIIESGMAKNRRLYPQRVLAGAVELYDGAKAFDHHRTTEELRLGATEGLVGQYRNCQVNARGIAGELHLLPSATRIAEAFDASLASQRVGLPPLVGISHDVAILSRMVNDPAGGRVEEVTQIGAVHSADVVAEPSAGGKALRAVAGGTGEPDPKEHIVKTLKELLDALRAETDAAKRSELLTANKDLLTEWGLDEAAVGRILTEEKPADAPAPAAPAAGTEQVPATVGAPGEATEAAYPRDGIMGQMLVSRALEAAGLDAKLGEHVTKQLPERITEADVSRVVGTGQSFVRALEGAGLVPTVAHVAVGAEDYDKKCDRLLESMRRNWQEGYTRISEAYFDITGERPSGMFDGSLAERIAKESWDMSRIAGRRATEAVDSTSWGEALGNTLHRRLIEIYKASSLQDWRKVVRTKPVNDFRNQELVVMGGYGALPTVLEGGTYQPLTTPADAENVYAPSKKGGTESITFETFKNDDIGALPRIPEALARSAAVGLHQYVFLTLIVANPNVVDLDGTVALFHSSRANTTAVALGHAGMNSLRQKMRDQANPGVSTDPLGLLPKYLIVPNELEELAYELSTSEKGIPSTTPGATDVPNLHRGIEPIVVDALTDANDWFLVAAPTQTDTIEIGFLDGKEDPELLMQDDPRVGAVFSADVVTWKIRHIYGGTVANYRAFQRGTQ